LATEFRVGMAATATAYRAGRGMIDEVLIMAPLFGSRLCDR
jgi:hypothetical protein